MHGKKELLSGNDIGQVELNHLDLRYEGCRIKSPSEEKRLEISILERGFDKAIEGYFDEKQTPVVLDGFKRIRCARRLEVGAIPFFGKYNNEIEGLAQILACPLGKALSMLEQSLFIDKLSRDKGMTVTDIAELLGRSRGWVGMRKGLLSSLTAKIKKELLSGGFPLYSYMYVLRPFIRMNKQGKSRVEEFVSLVSGKGFSHREIELLAIGFLQGPKAFRDQLRSGNGCRLLKEQHNVTREVVLNVQERSALSDLQKIDELMRFLPSKLEDKRISKREFYAQAHLLAAAVLSQSDTLLKSLKEFHDRSGKM